MDDAPRSRLGFVVTRFNGLLPGRAGSLAGVPIPEAIPISDALLTGKSGIDVPESVAQTVI